MALYRTATATTTRPSDLVQIEDPWTALQLDSAIVFMGTVIENAAQEQENVGTEKEPKWQRKYTMEQLLDPDFRLPRPPTARERERDAAQQFMALPGVRVIRRKENGS